jgi:hypothetical protein
MSEVLPGITNAIQALSYPQGYGTYQVFSQVARASVAVLFEQAIQNYSDELKATPSSFRAALSCASELVDVVTTEPLWSVEYGQLRKHMVGPQVVAVVPLLAHALLHLNLTGMICNWEVAFDDEEAVMVDRYYCVSVKTLRVSSTASHLDIAANCHAGGRPATIRFTRNVDDSDTTEPSGFVAAPLGGSLVIRPERLAAGRAFSDLVSELDYTVVSSFTQVLDSAFEVLHRGAPEYAFWVDVASSSVVPVRASGQTLISGSNVWRPGVLNMSPTKAILAVVEMLVHESTHQYLFCAGLLGATDDGSDRRLYYSPVKGCERPISKILVAYHAVGNILLASRALCASLGDTECYHMRNEVRFLPQLKTLDDALSSTSALTEIGEAIWLPLRERIARVFRV